MKAIKEVYHIIAATMANSNDGAPQTPGEDRDVVSWTCPMCKALLGGVLPARCPRCNAELTED